MNHDATHCADWTPKCPNDCYRAQLTKELKERNDLWWLPISWASLKGSDECKIKGDSVVYR